MPDLDELLRRNDAFAAAPSRRTDGPIPRQPVFLLTCLDPRTDPAAFLGLRPGDAPVVRNAGGRVTPAVIRDVAFIGQLAGTLGADATGPLFEVVIIHHTQCGTGVLADEGFRGGFVQRTGYAEADLLAAAVLDPAVTVRTDVQALVSAPQVSPRITVSGYVYDLATGRVTRVVAPTAPGDPTAENPAAGARTVAAGA